MKDLTKEEMVHLLETVLDGTLALTDGTRPYCIPFGFVFQNDTVYLSLFPKRRKLEYFQKDNNVFFNVSNLLIKSLSLPPTLTII